MKAGQGVKHEVYEAPKPQGPDEVVVTGNSGRSVIKKIDAIDRLSDAGEITGAQAGAAVDMLRVVNQYYAAASGLSRLSDEAPSAVGNSDPIRLYAKARRVYMPTQRPRNVISPKSSFDGWSAKRSNALKEMHRLRACLKNVPGESLRVLYALVIHPSDPHKRNLSLAAYMIKAYGYKNGKLQRRVVQALAVALDAIHNEYGERLEEAA
jgi:hypothetical protein